MAWRLSPFESPSHAHVKAALECIPKMALYREITPSLLWSDSCFAFLHSMLRPLTRMSGRGESGSSISLLSYRTARGFKGRLQFILTWGELSAYDATPVLVNRIFPVARSRIRAGGFGRLR
jgi:hypothetical protein